MGKTCIESECNGLATEGSPFCASCAPAGNHTAALADGEKDAAAVAKTPNRITAEMIENLVAYEEFMNPEFAPHVTVAVIKLKNGFVLVGHSAPADPANYDEAMGIKFARQRALSRLWALEGYRLCCELAAK